MTITIQKEQKEYDIKTNPDNTIQKVLEVLEEAGLLGWDEMPEYVYSVRKKRYIKIDKTFRQSGIYHGDLLRTNS